VQGFFSVPVDHLHALNELARHFGTYDPTSLVVVSPDLGYAKPAAAFARRLGVPVAAGAEQRFSDDRVQISAIIGEVADRDVIVVDDEITKGSTVLELLDRLREQKVRSVRVACTHGLFSGGALARLADQPDIDEIMCTDAVPVRDGVPKLHVLSIAPAMAEAIRRIHPDQCQVLCHVMAGRTPRPPPTSSSSPYAGPAGSAVLGRCTAERLNMSGYSS
jgi:ribose-phosphate pyrophosphokinase